MSKMRFSKIAFFVFVFCMLLLEKQKKEKIKWKKAKKPYKNNVFKGGHPRMRKIKKINKNCLTLFKGEEKCAFSCTLSALAKDVFLTKTVKTWTKNLKRVVSAEIAQNQK